MQRAGRSGYRDHQMLVIAMSSRHAAAILEFIRERFPRYSADRIGQDVGVYERNRRLVEYRDGKLDVIVQVDMIGEGTDIKSISTIVKADLVRAHSKTMQQVFRGMRYFSEWPEAANQCDVYAANDSSLVDTLDRIVAEEQIGVKMKKDRSKNALPNQGERKVSPWELTGVEHRKLRTHTVDFHHEAPPR